MTPRSFRRPQRPALAAAGALAIVAAGALGALVYVHSTSQSPVLVVSRNVARGSVLTPADLTVAHVDGSGIAALAPAAESSIVGHVAAVGLVPGEMMTASLVLQAPRLAPGESLVGVALKSGELPAGGVAVGDHVMVVLTPPPGSTPAMVGASGAQAGPGDVLVDDAIVYAAIPPDSSSASEFAEEVSILVPDSAGPGVAAASAAGQISLVALPQP